MPRFPCFVTPTVLLAIALTSAVVGRAAGGSVSSIAGLRLIGTARLPTGTMLEGTRVGGLSGLDYDAANDCWFAVSDDRSERAPARFYTLRLDYDAATVGSIEVTSVCFLRQADGRVYPDGEHVAEMGGEVPDPEALRLDPRGGGVWFTSEGDDVRRTDPWLREVDRHGAWVGAIRLPEGLKFDPAGRTGVRPNATLEGLSFTPGGDTLWLALEGPLLGDGPAPSLTHGAWSRFTHLTRDGEVCRQAAYPIDAIPIPPAPGRRADNGVSDVLALSRDRLLVLERNGAEQADGSWRFGARLYEAVMADATDVAGLVSLAGAEFQPARKRLLVDFRKLPAGEVWNLEGLSWGRRLPNGHCTLLVISDDNFDARQSTECLVFEVIPAP